jgi:hypothetical protein
MTIHLHFRINPFHSSRKAAIRPASNCGPDGECVVCDFPFGDMHHACIGMSDPIPVVLSEPAPLARTA